MAVCKLEYNAIGPHNSPFQDGSRTVLVGSQLGEPFNKTYEIMGGCLPRHIHLCARIHVQKPFNNILCDQKTRNSQNIYRQ